SGKRVLVRQLRGGVAVRVGVITVAECDPSARSRPAPEREIANRLQDEIALETSVRHVPAPVDRREKPEVGSELRPGGRDAEQLRDRRGDEQLVAVLLIDRLACGQITDEN